MQIPLSGKTTTQIDTQITDVLFTLSLKLSKISRENAAIHQALIYQQKTS